MLIDALGLILADHNRVTLGELTQPRALAAMPFAGRYRIIDFMLSSMVNSGIKSIGVLTTNKYRSLMDHVGTGSSWDLDRMQQGLSILPPFLTSGSYHMNSFDLSGLQDFIDHNRKKYVVLADSNVVMNVRLEELVKAHADNDADMTVMYNRDSNKYGSPHIALDLERGVLKDLLVDQNPPKTQRSSLGVLVMERSLLMDLVSEAVARGTADLSIENLLKLHGRLKIRGFEYRESVLRINSIATYFSSSMRLLEPEIMDYFFDVEHPIYTKVKNESPAHYGSNNFVANSMISDGCAIFGSVESSILFRSVQIGNHATVKNSIIFQNSVIGEGAELINVIVDKNTTIRPGVKLQGQPDYPVVIGKGVIV